MHTITDYSTRENALYLAITRSLFFYNSENGRSLAALLDAQLCE